MDCFARQWRSARIFCLAACSRHFGFSEVLCDLRPGPQTRQQMEPLLCGIDRLRAMRIDPGILHLANSAAIAALPESWRTWCGLAPFLYG